VGVRGKGEEASSEVETERDESEYMRLGGFVLGDVVLACEVSLCF
jgi:hypothetical protein